MKVYLAATAPGNECHREGGCYQLKIGYYHII
jgi:hypothetical protein